MDLKRIKARHCAMYTQRIDVVAIELNVSSTSSPSDTPLLCITATNDSSDGKSVAPMAHNGVPPAEVPPTVRLKNGVVLSQKSA